MENSGGIRSVTLRRNSDAGLGFSIMGGAGYEFPPVIYGIEKDSPAARSGILEAGDIILAINEREVVKLSTKEVLKCLRLSGDIVNIKYKRDPQVVQRVRQFLSTPNYDTHTPEITYGGQLFSATQVTITPSSPLKHPPKSSKIRQPTVISPSKTLPPVPARKTPPVSSEDEAKSPRANHNTPFTDVTKSNHNNASFSDDLFINHSSGLQGGSVKSMIPVRSPTHVGASNGKGFTKAASPPAAVNTNIIVSTSSTTTTTTSITTTPGNRKNYETFVMTGDAILNVSKLRNDDSIRQSPTKTSSKLTPMSPGPAPPHQIYSARSPKPLNPPPPSQPPPPFSSSVSEDSSSDISPPLPPPPHLTSTSSSPSTAHKTVKSEPLPPPPPPENDTITKGEELKNSSESHNAVAQVVGNGEEGGSPAHNNNNNNEDTSISSSVMSDSGGEEDDNSHGLLVKKKEEVVVKSKALPELNALPQREEELVEAVEKERYNQYVLLNGSEEKIVVENGGDGYKDEDEEEEEVVEKKDRKIFYHGESSLSHSGGESDGSDVESMRVPPVIKAVDLPSAERLAKRLYALDGFKVSDVWRQLSRANDFSREVATYFLNYFDFKDETLDISLRKFLALCPLRGETQERERVLTYFSVRYVECNPNFASQDAVHTLSCALMLLNTDLYSGARSGKMSCKDFITNLVGLNDGHNFPEPVLKKLYHAIKSKPLAAPLEPEEEESIRDAIPIDPSISLNTKEFKRGYLRRKSIFEQNGKKTPLGKRSWKLYFCRLRELLLSFSVDENPKATVSQSLKPLKLHHAVAGIAQEYQKKPFVFSLTLSDGSVFLFQSSDNREMHSWIDNLNLNAAKFSSPALEAPCGSTKKFEKPLLPSAISRFSSRDQLITHQAALLKWEEELDDISESKEGKKGSKKDAKERTEFYKTEILRYKAYIDVLERHLSDFGTSDSANEDLSDLEGLPPPPSVLVEIDENNT